MRILIPTTLVLVFCLNWLANCAGQDAVIFSDNFAHLNPGWGDDEELSVSGNKLKVELQPNVVYHNLYEQRYFDLANADIRIKVAELNGSNDQSAGLAFWATDDKNYYAALLQSDGDFYVARKTEGQWINPVPLQLSSEIRQGVGQTNELRVVTSGRSVTVYINGQQAARFLGFPPDGPSKFGIHAESGAEVTDWAFSGLSVCKGPKPRASEPSQDAAVLYADDYSTLDPGWHQPDERYSVGAHKLILKPKVNKSVGCLYGGRLFGDADIRIEIAETAGGTSSPGGILFWAADIDNLYATYVQADGSFYIGRKVNGEWTTLVPAKRRSEVRKGLGEVNDLRVVTAGDSATFYVNGRQVARIAGYKHPAQSKIGLQVESDELAYTWAISNLLVRKPSP